MFNALDHLSSMLGTLFTGEVYSTEFTPAATSASLGFLPTMTETEEITPVDQRHQKLAFLCFSS